MAFHINVAQIIDQSKLKLDTKNDGMLSKLAHSGEIVRFQSVFFYFTVEDLIQGIEECDGLDTLVLSGRSFGVEASEAIGETLRGKSTLKKALWSDMFVSKLKTEIPPALASLNTLLSSCR